jgi:hypothetical protein
MDRISQWAELRGEYQKQLQRSSSPKAVSFNFIDQLSMREMRNLREQRAADLARYQSLRSQESLMSQQDVSEGEVLSEVDSFRSYLQSSSSSLSLSSHLSSKEVIPELAFRPPTLIQAFCEVEPKSPGSSVIDVSARQKEGTLSQLEEAKSNQSRQLTSERVDLSRDSFDTHQPPQTGRSLNAPPTDKQSAYDHRSPVQSEPHAVESVHDTSHISGRSSRSSALSASQASSHLRHPEKPLRQDLIDRSVKESNAEDLLVDLSREDLQGLSFHDSQISEKSSSSFAPSASQASSHLQHPKKPPQQDLEDRSVKESNAEELLVDLSREELQGLSFHEDAMRTSLSSVNSIKSPEQSFEQREIVMDQLKEEPCEEVKWSRSNSEVGRNPLTEESLAYCEDRSRASDEAASDSHPAFTRALRGNGPSSKSISEPSVVKGLITESSEMPLEESFRSVSALGEEFKPAWRLPSEELPYSTPSNRGLEAFKQESLRSAAILLAGQLELFEARASREFAHKAFVSLEANLSRARENAVAVIEFRYRWELVHLYQVFQGLRYVCRAHKKWVQEVRRELVRRRTRSYFLGLRHHACMQRAKRFKVYRTLSKTFYGWRAWAARTRSSAVKAHMHASLKLTSKALRTWRLFYSAKSQALMKRATATSHFAAKQGRRVLQMWRQRVFDGKQVIPLRIYRQTSIAKKGGTVQHRRKLEIKVVDVQLAGQYGVVARGTRQ